MPDSQQSSVALAIFVKTPELSPVKTRLAREIGETQARTFYEHALLATEALALELPEQGIQPYWAVTEPEAMSHPRWQSLPRICSAQPVPTLQEELQEEPDKAADTLSLGYRLASVFAQLRQQHDTVMVIGSDCPQIDRQTLLAARHLAAQNPDAVVFGPSEDGGFYLAASSSELPAELWLKTTYSHRNTYLWLKQACKPDYSIIELPPLQDIDELEDLMALESFLEQQYLRQGRSIPPPLQALHAFTCQINAVKRH